jgi:hypothetical protein
MQINTRIDAAKKRKCSICEKELQLNELKLVFKIHCLLILFSKRAGLSILSLLLTGKDCI